MQSRGAEKYRSPCARLGVENVLDVAVDFSGQKVAVAQDEIVRTGLCQSVEQHRQGIASEVVHIARKPSREDGRRDGVRAREARQTPCPRRENLLTIAEAAEGSCAHGEIAGPELVEMASGSCEELAGPTISDDGAADGFNAARVALPPEHPARERKRRDANTGRDEDRIERQGRGSVPGRLLRNECRRRDNLSSSKRKHGDWIGQTHQNVSRNSCARPTSRSIDMTNHGQSPRISVTLAGVAHSRMIK
jgi:hypothetical protein